MISKLDAVTACLTKKVSAEDAVAALVALFAKLAVPRRDPVIPSVTINEPVIAELELTLKP